MRKDSCWEFGSRSTTWHPPVSAALEEKCDFLLLDATSGISNPGAELGSPSDLRVLRDAITLLRQAKKEEEIDVIYFGGIDRSGTDAAKAIALGSEAVVLGIAVALAMGGTLTSGGEMFVFNRECGRPACRTRVELSSSVRRRSLNDGTKYWEDKDSQPRTGRPESDHDCHCKPRPAFLSSGPG